MKLRVEYCGEWNYLPRAAGLAAEVKERFAAEAELVEGHSGVFKVWWDGRLMWDKRQEGRFPESAEILAKIGSAEG